MSTATFSNGLKLSISPLMDNQFIFESATLTEKVNGELPDLVVNYMSDADRIGMNDVESISIIYPNGTSIKCKGYVYSISFAASKFTVKFMLCDPSFPRSNNTNSFSSISNAIRSTYPGETNFNVRSDVDDVKIYQMSESNYKFCSRCCKMYRKYSIYGYAARGLMISSLDEWNPKTKIGERDVLKKVGSTMITNSKLLATDSVIDGYSDMDSSHVNFTYNDVLISANSEYKQLIANYLYNSSMGTSKYLSNYTTNVSIPLDITDQVEIISPEIKHKKFYVYMKITSITKTLVKTDYAVKSIDL
jgi:hypothetical protein